jgi:hypothetical protein
VHGGQCGGNGPSPPGHGRSTGPGRCPRSSQATAYAPQDRGSAPCQAAIGAHPPSAVGECRGRRNASGPAISRPNSGRCAPRSAGHPNPPEAPPRQPLADPAPSTNLR